MHRAIDDGDDDDDDDDLTEPSGALSDVFSETFAGCDRRLLGNLREEHGA